jgi:dTMP kinase
MTPRGRLIVFEGGEGSGKSTQAALLAAKLDAVLTREPGGTPLGEHLRSVLLDPANGEIAPRAELLLMAAARAQHVRERILPVLDDGQDVVCDRFSGSTLAYQGYGRGLPLEDVLVANELATDGLRPDLTILLDLPFDLASLRRSEVADRIESAGSDFHRRVVEGFRQLAAADPEGWVVVDGSLEPNVVAEVVLEAVANRITTPETTRHE